MKHRRHLLAIGTAGVAATFLLAGCGGGGDGADAIPTTSGATITAETATATAVPATATATAESTRAPSTLALTSDAFTNDGAIPVKHSCNGDGTSPALSWTGVPAATKSFALIVHDPDAPVEGGFTHWIVTDIPAAAWSLPAAVPAAGVIPGGGVQLVAYRGMCPPAGAAAHHYHFRLYALDSVVGAGAGSTKASVEAAMQGHILDETDLVGTFGR